MNAAELRRTTAADVVAGRLVFANRGVEPRGGIWPGVGGSSRGSSGPGVSSGADGLGVACARNTPRMDVALPLLGATNAWITPPGVISVAALIFTLASFWWIQVRRGRLRVETGPVFSGAITSGKIVFNVPLVFHNPGPAALVVADIKLYLSGGGGVGDENSPDRTALPKRMFWIAFHGSVYPESGKHRQFAMPFAVEGRKSVERVIEFQWDNPETQLENGPYTATVEVLVLPQRWRRRRWRTTCTYQLRTDLWSADRARLIPRTNDPEFDEAIKEIGR